MRAWDSVVAAEDRGYHLELRATRGALTGAIVLDIPAVPVSDTFRDAEPARALECQAHAQPIADTLPPHGELFAASDGTLWVLSPPTWADTAWSALEFGHDGAIVGRLRGSGDRTRRPFWFGAGRVMIRDVDEDGVVRLGVWSWRRR